MTAPVAAPAPAPMAAPMSAPLPPPASAPMPAPASAPPPAPMAAPLPWFVAHPAPESSARNIAHIARLWFMTPPRAGARSAEPFDFAHHLAEVERLLEDRETGWRLVSGRRDDDDLGLGEAPVGLQVLDDLPSVHDRHEQIEEHDANVVAHRRERVEGLAAVDGRTHLVALELEQIAERVPRLLLVLDDQDRRRRARHWNHDNRSRSTGATLSADPASPSVFSARGNTTLKVVPLRSSEETSTRPPCARTIWSVMKRPSPRPFERSPRVILLPRKGSK